MSVVVVGGLHIEMVLLFTIGHVLDGSGRTAALCEAAH